MVRKPSGEAIVRLTWAQLTWGIGILALILGSWFDLRSQVKVLSSGILGLEARVERLEQSAPTSETEPLPRP